MTSVKGPRTAGPGRLRLRFEVWGTVLNWHTILPSLNTSLLTYLTFALSFPMKDRPQDTCLHLPLVAYLYCRFHLLPTIFETHCPHLFFSRYSWVDVFLFGLEACLSSVVQLLGSNSTSLRRLLLVCEQESMWL